MIPTEQMVCFSQCWFSSLCHSPYGNIYVAYHFLTNKNAELAILPSNLHKNRVACCTAEFLLFAILC